MNVAFERFPQESVVALLGCEILSIFGTHQAIVYSGVHVPTSLALGFALSRPFRRVRLPIELAFAAFLKRLVPPLADVKMSVLIGGQVPSIVQSNPYVQRVRKWPGTVALSNVIDSYGACYFIGARWTGVLSVLLFTSLIELGVDVQPYVEKLGQLANTLNTWAGAVTLSSFLYPLSVGVGGAVIAPALGAARLKYFSKLTKQ